MIERDENGWMPIETADKSGGDVWLSNGSSMRLGFWLDGEQFENHGSIGGGWRDTASFENVKGGHDLHFAPTHWQPTPNLPVKR